MGEQIDFSLSTLSLSSTSSQQEDWDRSLVLDSEPSSLSGSEVLVRPRSSTTPRNSVVFPGDDDATPVRAGGGEGLGRGGGEGKRSLSALLRLHVEKGTDGRFSPEEASRVADVLGQWINASSSPYEGEDDFFARAHDDSSIPSRKSPAEGRLRGQSESVGSRPPSSAGFSKS